LQISLKPVEIVYSVAGFEQIHSVADRFYQPVIVGFWPTW
jgi:hypothetical protein